MVSDDLDLPAAPITPADINVTSGAADVISGLDSSGGAVHRYEVVHSNFETIVGILEFSAMKFSKFVGKQIGKFIILMIDFAFFSRDEVIDFF